jgi:hypothetical protein
MQLVMRERLAMIEAGEARRRCSAMLQDSAARADKCVCCFQICCKFTLGFSMSSAAPAASQCPHILTGFGIKKAHGAFGKPKNRFFVLKLAEGNVPQLSYYKKEEFVSQPDFMKGVLYFDNPAVSINVNRERKSLTIADASIGRYQVMQHIVHTLDIEFASVEELDKWHTALQKATRPKPQIDCSQ